MLSISWERQTHIPVRTSVGREKKRLEGREVEGRIVIAQRLKCPSKGKCCKTRKRKAHLGMISDQRGGEQTDGNRRGKD